MIRKLSYSVFFLFLALGGVGIVASFFNRMLGGWSYDLTRLTSTMLTIGVIGIVATFFWPGRSR